jgi:hypothetical protein
LFELAVAVQKRFPGLLDHIEFVVRWIKEFVPYELLRVHTVQTVDYFADVVATEIVYKFPREELLNELTSLEPIVLVMGIADQDSSYSIKYDGKEYPVTGAPWDTVSMKQIDANTFTSEVKKTGGKYHATRRTVISKDGKTMTTTTKGTNAEGQPSSGTLIYEKQ